MVGAAPAIACFQIFVGFGVFAACFASSWKDILVLIYFCIL